MDEFDSCDGVEFMDGSGDSDNTASMSTAATSINLGFLDDHEGIVAASDTEMLTTEWVPGSAGVDVSGPEPLCCTAFLDFTLEAPNAHLPSVVKLPRGPDFAHKWLFGVGDAGARGGGLGRHLVSPSSSSSVWNGRVAGCKDAPAPPRVPTSFLAVTQGDSTGGAVQLAGLGCGAALAV